MQRVTRKNEKAYADERGNRRNCDRKRITYNAPTEKMKKHMPMNAATFETATANVLHTTRQPKKMKENMPINATAVALRPQTSYMQRAVQQKRRAWANEHGNRRICDRNRIT